LSEYKNIHPFPKKYDSYEFLYASDVLITDYSSVFFDYAVSRQKIILFTYDKEDYLQDRGFYFPLEELPFPQVNTVEELIEEIRKPIGYDDTEFLKKFCAYDKPGVTKALCHKFLFGENSNLFEEQAVPDNGKKNVILFIGAFEKNGITTAALNLLNILDKSKYNYAIMYRINDVKRRAAEVKNLPEGISYYGFYHARSARFLEMIPYMIWREVKILPFKWIRPVYERISARDARRVFSTMRIDKAIQFTGYAYEFIGIFESLPCSRTIFAHSDMEQEISMKGNSDKGLLSHAYKKYDSVAAVTEAMIPPVQRIAEFYKEKDAGAANVVLCQNVMNYNRVRTMAEEDITFDSTTILSVARERLLAVLDSDAKKIISLGRFSMEKSHDRLIRAFEKLREQKEYENTYLIILGGYGPLYESTLEMVKKSPSRDHIFLVQYMSNPYPLLKKCDALALTSLYEALGLVLAEADMVGVPCFSTDIPGPRTFMQKYGGLLVENNEEGILQGMRDCLDGRAPKKLSIDYEEYNKEAIAQFESLIP
jgi:CDP-glycerol glycerophosphotransferase